MNVFCFFLGPLSVTFLPNDLSLLPNKEALPLVCASVMIYHFTQEPLCSFRICPLIVMSTSHLHRHCSRFVAFIGIFQEAPFETGLRSGMEDFRLKFNERPAFVMESTATGTQLIRSMRKFDGTYFVA